VNQSHKRKLFFTVILLIMTTCFIIAAFGYENPKARLIPVLVGIVTLIIGIISLIHEIYPIQIINRFDTSIVDLGAKTDTNSELEETINKKLLGSLGWITGFFTITFLAGFHIGIIFFMLTFLKIEGKVSWIKSIIAAVTVWCIIYMMFEMVMGFSLYKGIFFGERLPVL